MHRENPFPGMNPYMEAPRLWRGHHTLLISYISAELNNALPPEFAVRIEERVYVEDHDKDYVPDHAVVQESPVLAGNTATLERTLVTDVPLLLNLARPNIRERFIEIRMADEDADLIAVIEIVSPANKQLGAGRDEYRFKQDDVLHSNAHLIEIDLLRAGPYVLAPDEKATRERTGYFDYLISLHRSGTGPNYSLWPATLRDRLPRIAVPLIEGVPDVPLNLQTVVNRVYHDGGLARYMRYDKPCDPPLSAADAVWAESVLRERGLLPAVPAM